MKHAAIALAILVASTSGCTEHPEPMRQDLDRIEQLVVPEGATHLVSSGMERKNSTVSASWEFETTLSWPEYLKRIEALLQKEGFARRGQADHPVDFLKPLPGGACTVRAERQRAGSPLAVRITFLAWAS